MRDAEPVRDVHLIEESACGRAIGTVDYLETKKTARHACLRASHIVLQPLRNFLLTKTTLLVGDSCYENSYTTLGNLP